MNIFLLNIILILIFALFDKKAIRVSGDNISVYQKHNKAHIGGFFLIFLVLTLQLGLKGDFAIDTRNYHYIFFSSKDYKFLENIYIDEPLYELLNKITYSISGDFLVFLFVIAILTVGSYMFFVYRESNIMWLSLLILICSGNFYSSLNLMRNVLAAALFVFSIRYIYEENWKKYVISIILLSMMHKSALFMLPCYFLPKIQWRRLKTSVVIAAVFILGILIYVFAEQIISIATIFAYSEYLSEGAYGMSEGVGLLGTFKGMFYSGGVLINKKWFDRNNKRDMMIYNGCLLHFVVTICGAKILMIQRFCFYLIPFVMLGYPLIINKLDTLRKRKNFLYIIVCMLVLSGVTAIISNNYYFFWENQYISW